MRQVNRLNDQESMITLININDLNQKNRVLNRCHHPRTKPAPLRDSARQIGQIWSPTRRNMVLKRMREPKTVLEHMRVPRMLLEHIRKTDCHIRSPTQSNMNNYKPSANKTYKPKSNKHGEREHLQNSAHQPWWKQNQERLLNPKTFSANTPSRKPQYFRGSLATRSFAKSTARFMPKLQSSNQK